MGQYNVENSNREMLAALSDFGINLHRGGLFTEQDLASMEDFPSLLEMMLFDPSLDSALRQQISVVLSLYQK